MTMKSKIFLTLMATAIILAIVVVLVFQPFNIAGMASLKSSELTYVDTPTTNVKLVFSKEAQQTILKDFDAEDKKSSPKELVWCLEGIDHNTRIDISKAKKQTVNSGYDWFGEKYCTSRDIGMLHSHPSGGQGFSASDFVFYGQIKTKYPTQFFGVLYETGLKDWSHYNGTMPVQVRTYFDERDTNDGITQSTTQLR